jgi:hypothetical protein
MPDQRRSVAPVPVLAQRVEQEVAGAVDFVTGQEL